MKKPSKSLHFLCNEVKMLDLQASNYLLSRVQGGRGKHLSTYSKFHIEPQIDWVWKITFRLDISHNGWCYISSVIFLHVLPVEWSAFQVGMLLSPKIRNDSKPGKRCSQHSRRNRKHSIIVCPLYPPYGGWKKPCTTLDG